MAMAIHREELKSAVVTAVRTLSVELGSSDVAVVVEGEAVVLEGLVDDAWMSGRVEDAARAVLGVTRLINRLTVKPDIADEAKPKQTEFADDGAARAVTGRQL